MEVADPDHVEGDIERLPGLGLLPITTSMSGAKTTRQVEAQLAGGPSASQPLRGYEIHMGKTQPTGDAQAMPLLLLSDGGEDGCYVDRHCMGTYVHGILDNGPFIDYLLEPFADKVAERSREFDYAAYKEQQYDLLADHVRQHLDMDRLYQILTDD